MTRILILAYSHRYLKPIMQYTDDHIRQIRTIDPDITVDVIEPNKEAVAEYLPKADIVVFSPLSHPGVVDFSQAPNLKWMHITAAGVGDLATQCRRANILLTNSSGVHPIPIAEHVLMFMLMLARQATASYKAQLEQRQWTQENITPRLSELYGSTIGIVGFGRLGKRIAQVSKGFDMKVIALTHSHPLTQHPRVDTFYRQEDISKLLEESDFVTNCLPLTEETMHMFNADLFKQMKQSAYFINIGRGKTVVEADLITALKQGIIAGTGLDVYEEEPLPQSSELWSLDNAILTPHYAGWTPKYIDRMVDIFCNNLKAYLVGTKMPTLIEENKNY